MYYRQIRDWAAEAAAAATHFLYKQTQGLRHVGIGSVHFVREGKSSPVCINVDVEVA
jgi:hypothetical protein